MVFCKKLSKHPLTDDHIFFLFYKETKFIGGSSAFLQSSFLSDLFLG